MGMSIRLALFACALFSCGLAAAQTATDVNCTGCVHNNDLATSSVTSGKIATGAVTFSDLAANSVTTSRIRDGNVRINDLSTDVQALLGASLANLTTLGVNATETGVAAAECPSDRIPIAASCVCDDQNGARNFGVLFGCAVSGTGAVAGCFDEALTFDPLLPSPRAQVTAVCLGAESVDGTPWIPTSAGLLPDAALSKSKSSLDADASQWIPKQHATFESAIKEMQTQRSNYRSRILQRAR